MSINNLKTVEVKGSRNYTISKNVINIPSPYSPIVNKLSFLKENILTSVCDKGVLSYGEIKLDETLTYNAEIELSKSDVLYDIKSLGVNYAKEHHIEKAYHKGVSSKFNAVPKTATSLIELISMARISDNTLCVNIEQFKELQALTPATAPKGLDKLDILVIEGLTDPVIFNIDTIAGKCVVDFKQAEQDLELIKKGVSKWFVDVYLGIEFLQDIVK